jgi:hypothetical protein
MEENDIYKEISEADLILVGLGEDFDNERLLRRREEYIRGRELLEEADGHWLLPAWREYCLKKIGAEDAKSALLKLEKLLHDKNYFVVSVASDSVIESIPWKTGRLVMPCGNGLKKQCIAACPGELTDVTEEDRKAVDGAFEILFEGKMPEEGMPEIGRCSQCGRSMVFNNIYTESYNESGYLEKWELYKKWLQGTLNSRLLILELGVSLRFPSVIRWPFEKVAFYNKKAKFYRVNEKLPQMTEGLAQKGVSIAQNAIDWVNNL